MQSETPFQLSGMTPEQSETLLAINAEYIERLNAGMNHLAAAFHVVFAPIFDKFQAMFDTPEWQALDKTIRQWRRDKLQHRAMYYRETRK